MNLENKQQKMMFVLLAVLLIVHLATVITAQFGQHNAKRQSDAEQVPTFLREQTAPAPERLADFSYLFGIEAAHKPAAGDKTDILTLDKANPVLLAVSQSGQTFTAKIAVTEDKTTRFATLAVGDEFMGFSLKQLNLIQAEFSNGDQQLTLRMFKREENAKNK